MVDLIEIKQFLRIDTDAEDRLLNSFAKTAETTLIAAVGKGVNVYDSRAVLVQLMWIADWFENRTVYSNGKYSEVIKSLLLQLQLEYA